ncbi:MAG: hypothetical protein CVV64_04435 [Candidatus Wallbacteria bacterium HGW-Wallbacteria-1]|uniref:Uncharacterized protein n=1 Tax=Candidatus Wallbacteria bacterium HGW-Wallbacteria-1 TaxID=2013854 RepID=A0A2N1PRQ9_9BACT|nr:MAG: hypothetical protein CVV64_04435 [Candidatus Wallbacteria bacterium HGW-Wallbacteria-1]
MKNKEKMASGLDIRPNTLLSLPEGLSLEIIETDKEIIHARFSGEEETLAFSREQVESWVLNESRIPPELFLLVREIESRENSRDDKQSPAPSAQSKTRAKKEKAEKSDFFCKVIPAVLILLLSAILLIQVSIKSAIMEKRKSLNNQLSNLPDADNLPAGFSLPQRDSELAGDLFTILEKANPGLQMEKSGTTVTMGALHFQINNETIAVTHSEIGPVSRNKLELGSTGFLIPADAMFMEILARTCSPYAVKASGKESSADSHTENENPLPQSNEIDTANNAESIRAITSIPKMGLPEFLDAAAINREFIIKEGLQIQPGEVRSLSFKAEKAMEKDDVRTALPLLRRLLAHEPSNLMTRYKIGRVYLSRKYTDGAKRIFTHICEKDPENSVFRAGLAEVLRLEGDGDGFRREFEKVVAAEPWNSKAKIQFASGLMEFGMVDQATTLLEKAMKDDPDSREVVLQIMVRGYLKKGKSQGAIKFLKELVNINSNRQDLLDTYIVALLDANRINDALSASEERLNSGQSARAMGWYGHILFKYLSRPEQAVHWFRLSFQAETPPPMFLQDFGLATMETGEIQDSLWALETLLKNDSSPVTLDNNENSDSPVRGPDIDPWKKDWKKQTASLINGLREVMEYEIR